MQVSSLMRKWLRLPSRVALLLGIGALSAAGARAGVPDAQPGPQIAPAAGELLLRVDGGRVYLAEAGSEFRELTLGNTAEEQHLLQLLRAEGEAASSTGVRLETLRLAGDGGSGFHWSPAAAPGNQAEPQKSPLPAKAGGAAKRVRPNRAPDASGAKPGEAGAKG